MTSVQRARVPSLKKINMNTAAGQKGAAVAAFGLGAQGNLNANKERDADVTDVTDELTDGPENASNIMLPTGIDPATRARFKRDWKASMSQQIKNGSFLEFQGMRFITNNADVYDAGRNKDRMGKNVFGHIIKPAPVPRVYLKTKFELSEVNDDTSSVVAGGPTWKSLKNISKGVDACEPDVIVREGNKIKIFEMKMGLGKPETNKQPSEYFQLIRAVKLMLNWISEPEFASNGRGIQIEIYFIGWSATISANGRSNLQFNRPAWEPSSGPYHATATNGEGMARYAPINSAIVTTVISLLNFEKLRSLYAALTPLMAGWGSQRPAVNRWYEAQKAALRNAPYNAALSKPPLNVPVARIKAPTAAARRAAVATESGLRGNAARTFKRARNNNSGYNSNTQEGRKKRLAYTIGKLPPNALQNALLGSLTTAQLQNFLTRSMARNATAAAPRLNNSAIINKLWSNSGTRPFAEVYRDFVNQHTRLVPNVKRQLNAMVAADPASNQAITARQALQNMQRITPQLFV